MKIIKIILFSIVLFFLSFDLSFAQDQAQQFEGFNLQGYDDNGDKAWDVKGDTADIVGTDIKLSNVDANTYGKDKINVTAQEGTINQTSGKMHLQNDVVITSEEGQQLTTDSLYWDRDKDLVSTDDDVLITDERMTVTGKGMEAQPKLKKTQVNEAVTVRVDTDTKSKEDKLVVITSDGPMVIDQKESKATFQQNVVAEQEGQTLKADRMEVYFDGKMSSILEIICIGNVEIVQGENKTYAEKATYNTITEKMILSGRPKLIFVTEGENAITSFGN